MRKKKPEEHENHERWLVSYADFITLLFAFFVVLYAISQVDLKKLDKAAKSFGTSFGGSSEVTGESEVSRRVEPDAWRYAPIFPNVVPGDQDTSGDDRSLRELRDRLQTMLAQDKLEAGVRVSVEKRGLQVRLEPKAIFQARGTALTKEGQRLIERLAALIRGLETPVLLASHATPEGAELLSAAFERSSARAAAVARQLTGSQRVPPGRVFLSSDGQARPAGKSEQRSDTPELELVLLRKGAIRESLR